MENEMEVLLPEHPITEVLTNPFDGTGTPPTGSPITPTDVFAATGVVPENGTGPVGADSTLEEESPRSPLIVPFEEDPGDAA